MSSHDRLDHERSPQTQATATKRSHNHSLTKNPQVINSNSLRLRVQLQLAKREAVSIRVGIITVSKRELITSETADPHVSNAANIEVVGARTVP